MRVILIALTLFVHTASSAVQWQCFVDEDCNQGEFCVQRRCVEEPPTCPVYMNVVAPVNCWSDEDCPMGQTCFDGICADNWPC